MKVVAAASAAAILVGTIFTVIIVARATSAASENTAVMHAAAAVKKGTHAAAGLLPVVSQKDINERQQVLADKVLRALPASCRNSLQSFYVNYDLHPSNRGLGGESVIIVTGNVSDREFMALIVHECGHVADLGGIRGTVASGRSSFLDGNTPIYLDDPSVQFYQISWITSKVNQPGMNDKDFVSGYAMSDPFEDFAETFAYYALQQKEFAKLAQKNPVLKAKYDFMQQVVFSDGDRIAIGKHVRGKSVPWDVTKLPYVWIAKA
jgi:hypothetical protein